MRRSSLDGRWSRLALATWCVCIAALFTGATAVVARQELSPEEELAARYAPVIILQRQSAPCDDTGEPFLPAPVDVVFGDDAVVLREGPEQSEVESPVNGADLYELGEGFATDLPGSPRTPGCDYETHFKAVMGDQPPVIYAAVRQEAGRRGVALQYWFFYYFNQFNNLHEGDWEMIQLLFDADSVVEALAQEPVAVAFAQHDGGETAAWDAPKLERDGLRPVVYTSSGSHASYFGPGLWLAWGQEGSGFGCDVNNGDQVRIDPEVRLIPSAIAGPDDPFAWVTYGGRWGERDVLFYNGPTGPALKPRWTAPVNWMEGLRADSIRVTAAAVAGPAPSDVFCAAVESGSALFALLKPYPLLVIAIAAAGLAVAAWMVWQSWPALREAWGVYRQHAGLFVLLGALTLPISLAVSVFHYLLATSPAFAARTAVSEDSPSVQIAIWLATLAQTGVLALVVAPAVMQAVETIAAGRPIGARQAVAAGIARVPELLWTVIRSAAIILLLTIAIIGIPWAVNRSVRWMFGAQAAVLGGVRGKEALAESSAAVQGRWWQAWAVGSVFAFIGATPGTIVGLLLLIFGHFPVDAANAVGALVYALSQPFAIAGLTLLFLRWRGLSLPGRTSYQGADGVAGTASDAEPRLRPGYS